jgi:hypothetical protein
MDKKKRGKTTTHALCILKADNLKIHFVISCFCVYLRITVKLHAKIMFLHGFNKKNATKISIFEVNAGNMHFTTSENNCKIYSKLGIIKNAGIQSCIFLLKTETQICVNS